MHCGSLHLTTTPSQHFNITVHRDRQWSLIYNTHCGSLHLTTTPSKHFNITVHRDRQCPGTESDIQHALWFTPPDNNTITNTSTSQYTETDSVQVLSLIHNTQCGSLHLTTTPSQHFNIPVLKQRVCEQAILTASVDSSRHGTTQEQVEENTEEEDRKVQDDLDRNDEEGSRFVVWRVLLLLLLLFFDPR